MKSGRFEILLDDQVVVSGDDKLALIRKFRRLYGKQRGLVREVGKEPVTIKLPASRRLMG